jgi:hypothetical protein
MDTMGGVLKVFPIWYILRVEYQPLAPSEAFWRRRHVRKRTTLSVSTPSVPCCRWHLGYPNCLEGKHLVVDTFLLIEIAVVTLALVFGVGLGLFPVAVVASWYHCSSVSWRVRFFFVCLRFVNRS